MARTAPFEGLGPEVVLDCVGRLGHSPDGRLLALNSYENRVYRVGIEPVPQSDSRILATAVVAKFYRAQRWSDAQILEEHAFARELAAQELAVAEPLLCGGATLHAHQGFRYALFPCWRGASPELDAAGHRELLGRTLGRLHAVGAQRAFATRPTVEDWQCGAAARRTLLASGQIPDSLREKYAEVSAQLVAAVRERWDTARHARRLRLHGDCHLGNLLWNEQGPVFVDLDDCVSGPAVQDLWMMCTGDAARLPREWSQLLAGYRQFADFELAELQLIEPLRSVRMLNHAAWVAARWHDPAFPRAFPWFGEIRYWERHVTELYEQLEAVESPPLAGLSLRDL